MCEAMFGRVERWIHDKIDGKVRQGQGKSMGYDAQRETKTRQTVGVRTVMGGLIDVNITSQRSVNVQGERVSKRIYVLHVLYLVLSDSKQ